MGSTPTAPTTRMQVLYRKNFAWPVGAGTDKVIPDSHYPDDYVGRVVAVLPADDMSDPAGARDIVLDLTVEEVSDLRARKLKVSGGGLVPVTLEDRWGHIAVGLRARWGTQAEEVEEEARQTAEFLPDQPSLVRDEFDLEVARLRSALPVMVTHSGTGYYAVKKTPAHNDDVQSGPAVDNLDGTFTISLVTGGLGTADAFKGGYVTNATETETAAVVSHIDDEVTLEAHAGITIGNWSDTDDLDIYDAWATIQGALDQLWVDQGAATFAALQYIRIFAGTYDENVVPNVGLKPQYARALIIEGDPADDRANIILRPSGGLRAFDVTLTGTVTFRHMTVDGTNVSSETVRGYTNTIFNVEDCAVSGGATAAKYTIYVREYGKVVDCTVTTNAGNGINTGVGRSVLIARCTVVQEGARGSSIGIVLPAGRAEGCVCAGFYYGFYYGTTYGMVAYANCTVYDCTRAFYFHRPSQYAVFILNCILDTCTDLVYFGITVGWPDEVGLGQMGPTFVLRNNCFHTYTNFSNDGATQRTYAQFAALDRVDAAGDLDAIDPLMADPGADDFSLQSGSPCIHAGHGSGVTRDVDGNPFDSYHPDMGAVSTGIGPNVAYSG